MTLEAPHPPVLACYSIIKCVETNYNDINFSFYLAKYGQIVREEITPKIPWHFPLPQKYIDRGSTYPVILSLRL